MQEEELPNFDGHQHTFIQTVHWGVKSFYEKKQGKI